MCQPPAALPPPSGGFGADVRAGALSQPSAPTHALTSGQGVGVEHQSHGRQTQREVSATPSSRSHTTNERLRVITTGAPIAATNSACRADSTPNGTTAPSATLSSSCGIQPTGGRDTGRIPADPRCCCRNLREVLPGRSDSAIAKHFHARARNSRNGQQGCRWPRRHRA